MLRTGNGNLCDIKSFSQQEELDKYLTSLPYIELFFFVSFLRH